MKERILYIAWAILYTLCAGLGFCGEMEGVGKFFFVLIALIFFLPGIGLVVIGFRENKKKVLRTVRIVSIVSLVLTLGFLIANLAVGAAGITNKALDVILQLVSAPMIICGQYWVMSLFLWACLLFATLFKPKK